MEILNIDTDKQSLTNVQIGENVKIFKFVNAYGCTIHEGSKIGSFVEIQKGATIGDYCKISSHTFICEGVDIEDRVFVGHGVMFINDTFLKGGPAQGDQRYWRETHIGNHVSIV